MRISDEALEALREEKETARYYAAAIYAHVTQELDPVEALDGIVEIAEFAQRELLATIRSTKAQGLSLRAIAAATGLSHEKVRQMVKAD